MHVCISFIQVLRKLRDRERARAEGGGGWGGGGGGEREKEREIERDRGREGGREREREREREIYTQARERERSLYSGNTYNSSPMHPQNGVQVLKDSESRLAFWRTRQRPPACNLQASDAQVLLTHTFSAGNRGCLCYCAPGRLWQPLPGVRVCTLLYLS
jgi:hypothetical protein